MEGMTIRTDELRIEGCGTPELEARLIGTLTAIEGVKEASVAGGVLRVRYLPHLVLLPYLTERIAEVGFVTVPPEPGKTPGIFRRFLDRLAASNEKTFGSAPLDCCSLNDTRRKKLNPKPQ